MTPFSRDLPFTCCSLLRVILFQAIFFEVLSIKDIYSSKIGHNKLRNSPLSNKTLMIIPYTAPVEFRFNDSVKLQENMPLPEKVQIDIINWMARRYNFTWGILPTNETTLERPVSSGNKGSLSYLFDGSCDLVLGNTMMTYNRYQLIDMPYPWIQSQAFFLISKPNVRANFAAILKPFHLHVWVSVIISIVVVIIVFQIFNYRNSNQSLNPSSTVYLYVVGMLLSQGGPCASKRIVIRLVAGVWCLACFVLVQAYNSTLFTYVIAPNNEPSINSIQDIIKNPHIKILLEKNMGLDSLFLSTSDDNGIFKAIRDRLNGYPNSRCNLQSECIDLMLSSGAGNFVYMKTKSFLMEIMLMDFKKTGVCRFEIARESFMNFLVSFSLAKNSPYTKSFSEGIIEMNAFGLIRYRHNLNMANPYHCINGKATKKSSRTNLRLSLNNLTGAFVVLFIGYTTSVVAFIVENLVGRFRRYNLKNAK